MAAQLFWLSYLLVAFAAIPIMFRVRYGRWPYRYRFPARTRYEWVDCAYGFATGGFTICVFASIQPIATAPLVAGLSLGSAAFALQVWAVIAMGRSWRIGHEHGDPAARLVTCGPFRLMRHPIYVSIIGLSVAMAVLRNFDVCSVTFVAITTAYTLYQGRFESRYWRSDSWIKDLCQSNDE